MPFTTTSSICVPPSLSETFSPLAEPVTAIRRLSMPRKPISSTAGLVFDVKVIEKRPSPSAETPCPLPPFRMTDAPASGFLFGS